jgi:rhamnosyltransferase subunit B
MTIGSAGDVHPFVGLGRGLLRRGHQVSLAANPQFRDVVERAGISFLPLGSAALYEAMADDPDLWHPRRAFPLIAREGIPPLLRPAYELAAQAPAGTVVAASTLVLGARVAQEKLGVRLATVHLQPSVFFSALRPPVLPGLPLAERLPAPLARVLFAAAERAGIDPLLAPALDRFRAEVGLPPVRRIFSRWMHSTWKVLGLFPDWFAPPQSDWPANVVLPGFIRYDQSEEGAVPDPGTERFLGGGEPPVVFTAGSAMRHARDFFAASVEACLLLGRRGLLVAAHGEQIPRGLPPSIHHAAYVPFSRVFPRAAAAVHHGGIGTTAQALAAGAPQLVAPLSHDQPDNARRLERLGAGLSLPPRRYTARRAAAALDRLLGSEQVRERCRELRRRTDFDAALDRACDALGG